VKVCHAVVEDGKIPEHWSKSWLASVHKGKCWLAGCLTARQHNKVNLCQLCMEKGNRLS